MFGLMPFRDRNLPARDFFHQFINSFNNFFDDDFLTPVINPAATCRIDLRETDNAYIVEADLPGVKKGDITLHYENQYLTISAKRDEIKEVKADSYVRRERRFGQIQRCIYVDNVIADKIEAKFNDGVLTVTLPKQEKGKRRQGYIPIA